MQQHRTSGMTATAFLTTIFGGLVLFNGLWRAIHTVSGVSDLWREGALDYPAGNILAVALLVLPNLLMLAAGIVGIIAGIGTFLLCTWARLLSLAFAALSAVLPVASYAGVILFWDGAHVTPRFGIFNMICSVIAVFYSVVLFVAFNKRAWKITFANAM
jgi:hypothetical protein